MTEMTVNPCVFESLLPHPTEVELALEQEANNKYCRTNPEIIKQLHDPWICPAEFLPLLAYVLSVDVWNQEWPEHIRRAVCANAVTVHLNKGTPGGLDDAFAALGIKCEITEWWQQSPEGEPGTMELTVWLQDNLLPHAEVLFGAELIADVRAVIDRTKRASIHYQFVLGLETNTGICVAYSGIEASTLTRVEAQQPDMNIKLKPLTVSTAHSIEASTLTRVEAQQPAMHIKPESLVLSAAHSIEASTLARVEAQQPAMHIRTQPAGFLLGMSTEIVTLTRIQMEMNP